MSNTWFIPFQVLIPIGFNVSYQSAGNLCALNVKGEMYRFYTHWRQGVCFGFFITLHIFMKGNKETKPSPLASQKLIFLFCEYKHISF